MNNEQRTKPAFRAEEREMLTRWLDYHRATLATKCEGLSGEQLKERAVPPSSLSLLGLVRHLADVERGWFRITLNAEDVPYRYRPDGNEESDFDDAAAADPAEAFAAWREECAIAREIVAAAPSLDVTGADEDEVVSLRWILTHMIEEYARHNGHADLLRERIDGATGD